MITIVDVLNCPNVSETIDIKDEDIVIRYYKEEQTQIIDVVKTRKIVIDHIVLDIVI